MPPNSAYDALFAQSRDLLCDGLCAGLATIMAGAEGSITEALDKATDQDLKKIMMEARDLARTQRPTIEKQFREKYTAEVRKATNKAKKVSASLADISLGELSLVDDDDLNETLKYNAVAAKIKRKCEEELSAIDQRLRVLLDDPNLESDDNPFRAEIICDAFKHACRQAGGSVQARLVLLRLFEDGMPEAAAESYQKVNDLLVANQILPKIKYGITKSKSDPSKRAAAADKAGGGGGEKEKGGGGPAPAEEPEDEGDMFARIQKMLAPIAGQGPPPAPGMGMGGLPIMQGADLSGALTKIQTGDFSGVTGQDGVDLSAVFAAAASMTNVLKELKTSNVGQSMGQVDSMTLDIVSMLFDELFSDAKVPIALKGIIGRLQLPMLKVALKDKDLFTKKEHPARRLLDTLGQIGYRLPADFDESAPLFKRLEGMVQRIVDGFQESTEIFDTVRTELEEIIAEYDAKIAEDMKKEQARLERAEKLALAKSVAEHEITRRVEGKGAPKPVVDFLAQQWIKYLIILYARGGETEEFKTALETVDQLLWSIEPKVTVEDRRKLASSIPKILKGVRTGVAASGIYEATCTEFFGALMKCHTEVMQAPPPKPKEGPKAKPGTAAAVAEAMKKAEPPPPPPPEAELDFTAPVVVDNPFGDGGGQVEVVSEDLDFTATPAAAPAALEASTESAAPAPARAKRVRETTTPLPSLMVEGAWVEILDENERKHAARLHYVSPMKSHFLFVDRKGNKVYECSRSMLARRLNNFEIAILEGEPDASLFDRIMEGLFGKLGSAAPAPAG